MMGDDSMACRDVLLANQHRPGSDILALRCQRLAVCEAARAERQTLPSCTPRMVCAETSENGTSVLASPLWYGSERGLIAYHHPKLDDIVEIVEQACGRDFD